MRGKKLQMDDLDMKSNELSDRRTAAKKTIEESIVFILVFCAGIGLTLKLHFSEVVPSVVANVIAGLGGAIIGIGAFLLLKNRAMWIKALVLIVVFVSPIINIFYFVYLKFR